MATQKNKSKAPAAKKGLGRGLSSLMSTREAAYDEVAVPQKAAPQANDSSNDDVKLTRGVPIEFLEPNTYQPRIFFDDAKARELVESVKRNGILQPILVRTKGKDKFEIIAGERRWRAAQSAGLHEVPVVVKELSDSEALEVAIIENIQRHDLNPIEEALGYKRLMDEFSHTQNALANVVGKSRSHIANILRLLSLPESVQKLMEDGSLSMGHARALITAEDPAALAKLVVRDGLSVRQTENMAKNLKSGGNVAKPKSPGQSVGKDADTVALENELSSTVGLKITLDTSGGEAGVVKIHYSSLEQLDDICSRLNNDS